MVFARYAVDVEPIEPGPETHDPQYAHHQAVLDGGNATQIATLCGTCFDLMLHWRRELAPIVAKRRAVEPILTDPANATDPRMASWEAQYTAILDDECAALHHVLWEGYHTARFWAALSVTERVKAGLHTRIGLDARDEPNGATLALTTARPGIQHAAPLPIDYVPPWACITALPTNVALMLGTCPF